MENPLSRKVFINLAPSGIKTVVEQNIKAMLIVQISGIILQPGKRQLFYKIVYLPLSLSSHSSLNGDQ